MQANPTYCGVAKRIALHLVVTTHNGHVNTTTRTVDLRRYLTTGRPAVLRRTARLSYQAGTGRPFWYGSEKAGAPRVCIAST